MSTQTFLAPAPTGAPAGPVRTQRRLPRFAATGLAVNTLIASGLALFVITLAVNMLARWVVNRRADFSGAN